jgi:hypothetical protein
MRDPRKKTIIGWRAFSLPNGNDFERRAKKHLQVKPSEI